MDLHAHYAKLHRSALDSIGREGFECDRELSNESDDRRGLTVLLRPGKGVMQAFQGFMDRVKEITPDQYFYPESDIHVTIMSIISCYRGFALKNCPVQEYVDVLEQSLAGIGPMEIEFRGVFASASCLMIQGFPKNEELERFRQGLRRCFSASSLEQSLDRRYRLLTAHSTVVRFTNPVSDSVALLRLVERYRGFHFGSQMFDKVEFVFNDWYQRKAFVKTLAIFKLT